MKRQIRELRAFKRPKAYAAGILYDADRVFFLQKRTIDGKVELELPGAVVFEGDDPVSVVKTAFKEKAGIDCEVGTMLFEGRYNSGSKKRKFLIPALAFQSFAKERSAHQSSQYCGIKWVNKEKNELRKERIARNSEWILAAMT